MKMFTIYDIKSNVYSQPFFTMSPGSAERILMDACSDPKSTYATHPKDFVLFELGEWAETTGRFKAHDEIRHICDVVNCHPNKKNLLQENSCE